MARRSGPADTISVQGLDAFRRELGRVDKQLGKELGKAHQEVAEPVASDARRAARAHGGALGKAAPSIKAAAKQKAAVIAIGGARYPFALGGEFGAKRDDYRARFGPWTGNRWTADAGDVGYALHPAIHRHVNSGDFVDTYDDMIRRLTAHAFPD